MSKDKRLWSGANDDVSISLWLRHDERGSVYYEAYMEPDYGYRYTNINMNMKLEDVIADALRYFEGMMCSDVPWSRKAFEKGGYWWKR